MNNLLSSAQFQCRGVKSPSDEQAETLDKKVSALQSKAHEGTRQELTCSHILSLPVLAREDAVPVMVNTFRDGTREVLCPCLQQDQCSAIAGADILGKEDITSQFNPDQDFELPQCPYVNRE